MNGELVGRGDLVFLNGVINVGTVTRAPHLIAQGLLDLGDSQIQ
jgi:hypothetical protein